MTAAPGTRRQPAAVRHGRVGKGDDVRLKRSAWRRRMLSRCWPANPSSGHRQSARDGPRRNGGPRGGRSRPREGSPGSRRRERRNEQGLGLGTNQRRSWECGRTVDASDVDTTTLVDVRSDEVQKVDAVGQEHRPAVRVLVPGTGRGVWPPRPGRRLRKRGRAPFRSSRARRRWCPSGSRCRRGRRARHRSPLARRPPERSS